ncbi:MAG: hypothetical protein ACR2PL_02730 [Dehalococcoidia bacterium]
MPHIGMGPSLAAHGEVHRSTLERDEGPVAEGVVATIAMFAASFAEGGASDRGHATTCKRTRYL